MEPPATRGPIQPTLINKENAVRIESNHLYFCTKSGNQVKAIAPAEPYMGLPCWTVERTTGASAGKQMIVPARALVTELK